MEGNASPSNVELLAPGLANWSVERAICSDLLPARETAELVGWSAAEPDVRWREIDVGDWTGVHAQLVRDEEQDAYRAWREGRLPPPGGEAVAEFATRVQDAAAELLSVGGTTAGHRPGGPIRVACAGLLRLELAQLARVANASASVLESTGDGVRLAAYNAAGDGHEGPWP
jgi:glucosyl-3-phosphoglycerate phosphatase